MSVLLRSILALIIFVSIDASMTHANGSSGITLGVGGSVGIHKEDGFDSLPETFFVNQANVRLKLLWIFGVDYSFDLTRDLKLIQPTEGKLNYRSRMRATALLYLYSGKQMSFYLGGGIGGAKFIDLTKIDSPSNSYHSGLGFEMHATQHFSFDISFMLLAPGVHSIIDNTVSKVDNAIKNNQKDIELPKIGNFLSFRNHEFMIRIFIFL